MHLFVVVVVVVVVVVAKISFFLGGVREACNTRAQK